MEPNKVSIITFPLNILSLDISSFSVDNYKVPFLYETWNWEGDECVLPYKWNELIKNSELSQKYDFDKLKQHIKLEYYKNDLFDKKSFFFLTYRSEVAGCVYYNSRNNMIEFLLVNLNKHSCKGVEEALINLAVKKCLALEGLKNNKILLNLSITNISQEKLNLLGFN
jgi:hypothetical protein